MSIESVMPSSPSHLHHHKAVSAIPWSSLVIYFIHSINNVYVSIPIFQFFPPPLLPWYPYISSLRLSLCVYFANKIIYTIFSEASLVAQTVKSPPAVQESWVQSLGQDDPLGKGMATHSSILAWRILWPRGAWGTTVYGVIKSWAKLSN